VLYQAEKQHNTTRVLFSIIIDYYSLFVVVMSFNKLKVWNVPLLLVVFACSLLGQASASVSYDHKAIIINGQRRILLSGSIHYPRSTPEVLHSNVFQVSFHFGLFFFYQMGTLKFLPFFRCGQILFRRQRKEVWMSFKLMFSGMDMNLHLAK